MATLDLISYNVLAKSVDIKRGLVAQKIIPYESVSSVAAAVKRFARKVKIEVQEWINKQKENGDRFSVTTDEWTDMNVRRFACVNVHLPGGDTKAIGMIRVEDTLDAKRAAQLLSDKLKEFALNIDHDIVSTTTDGASVMVAMGKRIDCNHQLCHSHGIHLVRKCDEFFFKIFSRLNVSTFELSQAVCGTLYKKDSQEEVDLEALEDCEGTEDKMDDEDEDYDDQEDNGTSDEDNDADEEESEGLLPKERAIVINKVRKIYKVFKRSPKKNDKLQQCIVQVLGLSFF